MNKYKILHNDKNCNHFTAEALTGQVANTETKWKLIPTILLQKIANQCNNLEKEGFDVLRITPINSGNLVNNSGSHYTESVIITAQKV